MAPWLLLGAMARPMPKAQLPPALTMANMTFQPIPVSALFDSSPISVWSKYLCKNSKADYQGEPFINMAKFRVPPNSKVLIYGPSYMRQIVQLVLAAHCRSEASGTGRCSLNEFMKPGPPEPCGWERRSCIGLGTDLMRWELDNNSTLVGVINHAPLQVPAWAFPQLSRFDKLGEILSSHTFTHALVMEPHDIEWWRVFLASRDQMRATWGARSSVKQAAVLAADASPAAHEEDEGALSWAEEFWRTFKAAFAGAHVLNVRSWWKDNELGVPPDVLHINLRDHVETPLTCLEQGTSVSDHDTSIGVVGWHEARPHLCAFVSDPDDGSMTTGPLVQVTDALMATAFSSEVRAPLVVVPGVPLTSAATLPEKMPEPERAGPAPPSTRELTPPGELQLPEPPQEQGRDMSEPERGDSGGFQTGLPNLPWGARQVSAG